ncbi:DNA helicase, partial [Tanacetum coccineum]
MDAPNVLFGGKTIVLGGDFCQTLPVKKVAGKEELIAASIAESYLWCHFRICTLKENMRLQRFGLTSEERKRSETFAKWLLDVGDGKIGEPEEEDQDSSWITTPPEYSVDNDETSLSNLINFIYDDTTLKTPTAGSLKEKAIVCPKNATADDVNAKILSNIKGQSKIYLSNDEAIPMGGLCNGTRMIVRCLMSKLIEAQIITGTRVGEKGIRFTCEAMITSERENRDWKYASCSECSKGSTQVNGIYTCEDHGKQDPVTYRSPLLTTSTKIRFAPSAKKGAGEFVAEDILDIGTTVETHTTVASTRTILATGSATSIKDLISIDQGTL